jgi:protocatechuate 3,4-dioxygenase beta subunit
MAPKTDGAKPMVGSAVNAKPATVTGMVINEKGQPLSNVLVSIGALARATTNSDGKFTLQSITPAEHQITAAASGFRTHSRTLKLDAGEVETINFTLRAAEISSSSKPTGPVIQKPIIPLRDIRPQQKLPQASIQQRK